MAVAHAHKPVRAKGSSRPGIPVRTPKTDVRTTTSGPIASLSSIPAEPDTIHRKCAACEQEDERQADGMSVSPQLQLGSVNDPAEREADTVADRVMKMPLTGSSALPEKSIVALPTSIRMKEGGGATGGTMPVNGKTAAAIRDLGNGNPLQAGERNFFEPRFGRDLSHVRIHDGSTANKAASSINARAFTRGSDIVFARGEYGSSLSSRHLMAHELAHVGQNTKSIRMKPAMDIIRRLTPEQEEKESLQFLNSEWTDVGELGIVYRPGTLQQDGGANFRKYPGEKNPSWLPQNTKVFILKESKRQGIYAVTTLANDGFKFGYITKSYLWRHLPDPKSDVLKIKAGESPIEIAMAHYAKRGFDQWGKDARYVVNALVWVNANAKHNGTGDAGIKKPGDNLNSAWFNAKSTAGAYIWLPGKDKMNALYQTVYSKGGGTGSITADLWQMAKTAIDFLGVGVGFVGGLIHGFLKSIYDMLAGLVQAVVGILKSLFTGSIIEDAKKLWTAISNMTWADFKAALGTIIDPWLVRMKSKNPLVRGHAYGYWVGYIIAEIASLFISGGTLAAVKGAVWSSKIGILIQKSAGVAKLVSGLEKSRKALSAGGKLLKASKPFRVLNKAQEWARAALRLTANTISDLSLAAINRLRLLPDEAIAKLRSFTPSLQRICLGCASPCKVDIDAIQKFLKSATGGKRLKTQQDVLDALDAVPSSSTIRTATIKSKMKRHPAIMEMVIAAELTDVELAVISKFLTAADLSNKATAYRTFVRTLTALTGSKVKADIRIFNAMAKSLVDSGVRIGSALKGSIFETWIKLNIYPFVGKPFIRATFPKKAFNYLRRTRTSDAFLDGSGALWDFKHTVGRVPNTQADDYLMLLANGARSTEGHVIKSVNYMFPTIDAAKLNRHLIKKGARVWYISPPKTRTRFR